MLLTELQTYSITHLASLPFSCASSEDNSFSFLTEKGLDILELAPDPKSVSPSLSCRRYVIRPAEELPTAKLGINPNELLTLLDREQAYALITDTIVSPSLARTLTPHPTPCWATWSPTGILQNQRCILAVLTNTGNLSLYVLVHCQYKQQVDISSLWLKHCKSNWQTPPNNPQSMLTELQNRARIVNLTALCWLDQVQEQTGWLATASKKGTVVLWQIKAIATTLSELDVILFAQFETGLIAPTRLHWTALNDANNSLIVVAGSDGRVSSFSLTSLHTMVPPCLSPVVSARDLWTEADSIPTHHMTSWPWLKGLLVVAVKGAFVITFYLPNGEDSVTHAAYRSCDVTINGMTKISPDDLLVVTRSSRFTRLTITLASGGKLLLKSQNVESYINITHMGCYGLSMTHNNVICFILLSVNQSYDHLRLREPTQVVVCSVTGLLEPLSILQDPQRPISQLWDCLELLRVQILQKMFVSQLSYPRSVLDNMSIDQLTITLWWATFATAVEDDEKKQQALLNLRNEVESLVISCHFFKRVALLLSNTGSYSDFQLQCLGILRKWLNQIQNLPEEFCTTLITGKTLLQQLSALDSQIPADEFCTICGDVIPELGELFYSECSNGHRLPRCSLSLVQCSQLPYYICSQCGALAHPLAVKECGIRCNLCGGVLRIDEEILKLDEDDIKIEIKNET